MLCQCVRFFEMFYGIQCTGSTTRVGSPDTFPDVSTPYFRYMAAPLTPIPKIPYKNITCYIHLFIQINNYKEFLLGQHQLNNVLLHPIQIN